MDTYAPLWVKSHYSFLRGASSPEAYIERCHALGLRYCAITDRHGMYGIVAAHKRAKELGVALLVGTEIDMGACGTLVLLAQNKTGYQHACHILSQGHLTGSKDRYKPCLETICSYADGLMALWAKNVDAPSSTTDESKTIHVLREAFSDRLFLMAPRHFLATDLGAEQRLCHLARRFSVPIVAATEVLYAAPERRDLQDVMTCIRTHCTLTDAQARTRINASHGLCSTSAFYARFSDRPTWIQHTLTVAEQCEFSLDTLRYVYPAEAGPHGMSSTQWLRTLTMEGAHIRYPNGIPDNVLAQLDKELKLIQELDYGGYFLTMKELVDFCNARGILCQGRGSAANSAVCYCLGITAVDPVRMDLLFERFLSRERKEPPDIDLDIAHQRREEVIQHVYERYGRSHAAMVANFVRYRPRSAVRDVGKVLGIDDASLGRVAKQLSHSGQLEERHLEEAGMCPSSPLHQHLIRLSNEILDAPRHMSIHPGGFIIGSDPIAQLVPVEHARMEGRTVIQWDKYAVEDMGLFKLDLLGLGALSQIDDCLSLIQAHHGDAYTLRTIPSDCGETFRMLAQGDTIGVFQLESRAQMSMLPRLKPRMFYDIVIQISIVRPGPITGGMVHPYLRRRNKEEPIVYPHPSLEPVLRRTLGVPLFQEQVMKLAVVAADYTPGEADQLRRDMGAWRAHGRLEQHRTRFIQRMCAKGIASEFAERVFEQIQGFGEYGFPESHAASFALIAWATAWLKKHYPAAFTASLLNAQPMGFYSPATLIQHARRAGVPILAVCVQQSDWSHGLETCDPQDRDEHANTSATRHAPVMGIRLGFRQIQGFRQQDGEAIVAARTRGGGFFLSLDDFIARVNLREDVLLRLAKAGAFDVMGVSRREAIWHIRHESRQVALPLFPHEQKENDAPTGGFAPLSPAALIHWDHDSMQASAQGHILESLRPHLTRCHLPTAQEVAQLQDGQYARYAGIIIVRQRPSTAAGVVFLTMEDETGFVNVVIWTNVWERYATFVRSHAFVLVRGRVQQQAGVTHLIATSFARPPIQTALPMNKSHDFH